MRDVSFRILEKSFTESCFGDANLAIFLGLVGFACVLIVRMPLYVW